MLTLVRVLLHRQGRWQIRQGDAEECPSKISRSASKRMPVHGLTLLEKFVHFVLTVCTLAKLGFILCANVCVCVCVFVSFGFLHCVVKEHPSNFQQTAEFFVRYFRDRFWLTAGWLSTAPFGLWTLVCIAAMEQAERVDSDCCPVGGRSDGSLLLRTSR